LSSRALGEPEAILVGNGLGNPHPGTPSRRWVPIGPMRAPSGMHADTTLDLAERGAQGSRRSGRKAW
jgi:hypothetical protein